MTSFPGLQAGFYWQWPTAWVRALQAASGRHGFLSMVAMLAKK
jgi:hypothetical protein